MLQFRCSWRLLMKMIILAFFSGYTTPLAHLHSNFPEEFLAHGMFIQLNGEKQRQQKFKHSIWTRDGPCRLLKPVPSRKTDSEFFQFNECGRNCNSVGIP